MGLRMDITISCELYSRMIEIPKRLAEDDKRRYFECLYIERKNKRLYVIATNVKIAAVQYLGASDGPDECTAICVNDGLIEACDKETPFDSKLSIVSNPILKFTAIKSSFGYQFPGNAWVELPDPNEFTTWREWFPEKVATASSGVMYWNTWQIEALLLASTSGGVTFPEFIDTSIPIVIRDDNDPHWIGVFMNNQTKKAAATVPDWI
jgi:hypothetical protein